MLQFRKSSIYSLGSPPRCLLFAWCEHEALVDVTCLRRRVKSGSVCCIFNRQLATVINKCDNKSLDLHSVPEKIDEGWQRCQRVCQALLWLSVVSTTKLSLGGGSGKKASALSDIVVVVYGLLMFFSFLCVQFLCIQKFVRAYR